MVDIKDLKRLFDYCTDLASVSFAEVQYEMKLSYPKARELVEFFVSNGWFSQESDKIRIDHDKIPPIKPTPAARERMAQQFSERRLNIKLVEELVRRGSMTYDDINEFIEARLKTLGTMHARQLQILNFAFILDGVVYPTIDMEMLAYLKSAKGV